eukprot:gene24688-30047_t
MSAPIDSSNIGSKLLKKMGWKEGEGIGLQGDGIKDPINVHVQTDKAGIGCKASHQEKLSDEVRPGKRARHSREEKDRVGRKSKEFTDPLQYGLHRGDIRAMDKATSAARKGDNEHLAAQLEEERWFQEEPEHPSSFRVLPRRTRVRLRGLKSAAGSKHNGKVGWVTRYNTEEERYVVDLEDGSTLAVRFESCLQLVPGVMLTGMESAQHLNLL